MSRLGGQLHYCPKCGMVLLVAELSLTEIEVLQAYWEGLSTMEIAKIRFVSHKTIESHRHSCFLKAGVRNMAELFRWGLKKGYLQT